MHLSILTHFQIELIRLIDAGQVLPVSETSQALQSDRDILIWLKHKFPGVDFSVYSGPVAEWGDDLDDALKRHANAYGADDLGISTNGLCLLLALTVSMINGREWQDD
jgi:hypothetical protein